MQPGFDDASWKRSAGGFGGRGIDRDHPAAKIATKWETDAIWLRRRFTLDAVPEKLLEATLEMFHDEDAEVYLNGQLILSVKGYTTDYVQFGVPAETFRAAAKKGGNVLAVKVVQTAGAQYFDLGLSFEVRR